MKKVCIGGTTVLVALFSMVATADLQLQPGSKAKKAATRHDAAFSTKVDAQNDGTSFGTGQSVQESLVADILPAPVGDTHVGPAKPMIRSPLGRATVTTFMTGFEAGDVPPYAVGNIAGQNGWIGSGDPTVTSNVSNTSAPFAGTQELRFAVSNAAATVVPVHADSPAFDRSAVPPSLSGFGVMRASMQIQINAALPLGGANRRLYVDAQTADGTDVTVVGIDMASRFVIFIPREGGLFQNGSRINGTTAYHEFIVEVDEDANTYQIFFDAAADSTGPGGAGPGLRPLFGSPQPTQADGLLFDRIEYLGVTFTGTGTPSPLNEDVDAINVTYTFPDIDPNGVARGFDFWQTDGANTSVALNLPGDFFGLGSAPINDPAFPLCGEPFDTTLNVDGVVADPTDTIVERLANAPNVNTPGPIPIELVALNLQGSAPIEVTFAGESWVELWEVGVGLSAFGPLNCTFGAPSACAADGPTYAAQDDTVATATATGLSDMAPGARRYLCTVGDNSPLCQDAVPCVSCNPVGGTDETEPNGTQANADPTGISYSGTEACYNGDGSVFNPDCPSANPSDDIDRYALTVNTVPANICVCLDSASVGATPTVRILDSTGAELTSVVSGTAPLTLCYVVYTAGTYYVGLSSSDNNAYGSGAECGPSTGLDFLYNVSICVCAGDPQPALDVDMYHFVKSAGSADLPLSASVAATAGSGLDTLLSLIYDDPDPLIAPEVVLVSDDSLGLSLNSRIDATLLADGDWYLAVSSAGIAQVVTDDLGNLVLRPTLNPEAHCSANLQGGWTVPSDGDYELKVCLGPDIFNTPSTMTISGAGDPSPGGTFQASLYVQPRFVFNRICEPNFVGILDTGAEGMDPDIFSTNPPGQWVRMADAGLMLSHDNSAPAPDGFNPGVTGAPGSQTKVLTEEEAMLAEHGVLPPMPPPPCPTPTKSLGYDYACGFWFDATFESWVQDWLDPGNNGYSTDVDQGAGDAFKMADDFFMEFGGTITGFEWDGLYLDDLRNSPDNITINLYSDGPDGPNECLFEDIETFAVVDARVTGPLPGVFPYWHYTYTLAAPITVGPGFYWLSVYNDSANDIWFWGFEGTPGLFDDLLASTIDPVDPPTGDCLPGWAAFAGGGDMIFNVNVMAGNTPVTCANSGALCDAGPAACGNTSTGLGYNATNANLRLNGYVPVAADQVYRFENVTTDWGSYAQTDYAAAPFGTIAADNPGIPASILACLGSFRDTSPTGDTIDRFIQGDVDLSTATGTIRGKWSYPGGNPPIHGVEATTVAPAGSVLTGTHNVYIVQWTDGTASAVFDGPNDAPFGCGPSCTAPALAGARSIATHSTGEFFVDLDITGSPNRTTEPRSTGLQVLDFDFDQPILSGSITLTPGGATAPITPGAGTFGATGGRATLAAAQGNAVVYTITISATTGAGCDLTTDICVSALVGDFDGNDVVNAADKGTLVGFVNQTVSQTNARFDVSVGGGTLINAGDVGFWTGFFGTTNVGEACP